MDESSETAVIPPWRSRSRVSVPTFAQFGLPLAAFNRCPLWWPKPAARGFWLGLLRPATSVSTPLALRAPPTDAKRNVVDECGVRNVPRRIVAPRFQAQPLFCQPSACARHHADATPTRRSPSGCRRRLATKRLGDHAPSGAPSVTPSSGCGATAGSTGMTRTVHPSARLASLLEACATASAEVTSFFTVTSGPKRAAISGGSEAFDGVHRSFASDGEAGPLPFHVGLAGSRMEPWHPRLGQRKWVASSANV